MSGQDEFSRFMRDSWDRAADRYEGAWSALTGLFIEPLLDAARVGSGMRALDVACGPGYVASAALKRGAIPAGVDVSARMIALARRGFPGIEFQVGEAESLPFGPASFDRVVMNFGVLHMTDPIRALGEARRVLTPGGRVAFTVWSAPGISPGAKVMFDAIETHGDLNVPLPEGPPRDLLADEGRCRAALESSRFVPATIEYSTRTENWIVPTAAFYFDAERDAGVRTAALLARQTPERLAAIRSAVEAGAQPFRVGNGFALPMAAHIVTAACAVSSA